MFHELRILFAVIILGVFHLMIATHLSTKQRGLKWNLSPRDGNPPELTGAAARVDRSYKNFMETFAFFAASVLLVHALQKHSQLASIGALVYLVCRVIYIPIYAMGVIGVRTIIWLISMVGIALILASLFI